MEEVISSKELSLLTRYWRAANYLAAGQIYLLANPLLKEPLTLEHIKPRLLGHWGTSPGLNFLYLHLNRLIQKTGANVLFVTGPGHGAPALLANTYLEGTYSEHYPHITEDEAGMQRLFKQFSFPGGIPSHVAAETPGSIHEGGELGYCLAHSFGAAFDHPDLIVACVVGDGEAETGPLATSWHGNKFLNPERDGAVLPILHLNGYKIAEPTILARMPKNELTALFTGYGYEPIYVEGDDPEKMHSLLANALTKAKNQIKEIQRKAREEGEKTRPIWPMIIFRTPKGWTGPKVVDGLPVEGTWRAHQVPLSGLKENQEHLKELEKWLLSYKASELFDANGTLLPELKALAPKGELRMGASPYANGGCLLKDLNLPDFEEYSVPVKSPGKEKNEATRVLGRFLRDVFKKNAKEQNFRLFGPDETASNRLSSVFEETSRVFMDEKLPTDEFLSSDGRVMEVLSEHLCEGWLEGYLLTGRHGLFSCYEAFIHIIDSMFNQHAKWLSVCRFIPWRRPIASLNYLLTSHVWRQDHNGFSHQDPGFIGHMLSKKADVVRIYLPFDANTLLTVTNHCLKSRNYINLIVCGKQPELQWLSMDEAKAHCSAGIGIWEFASNDKGGTPDVILACAGDVPTLETLAAVSLLREHFEQIKVRVVNVIDLMTLQPRNLHPHGLDDTDYNAIFPKDIPVLFAFHGYPSVIHQLIYKRANAANVHVRGYNEEGTTTTPFDMVVLNHLDRFHLANDALDLIPRLKEQAAYMKKYTKEMLLKHKEYIHKHGEDMPEVLNWTWTGAK